jgi:hypothetical protein
VTTATTQPGTDADSATYAGCGPAAAPTDAATDAVSYYADCGPIIVAATDATATNAATDAATYYALCGPAVAATDAAADATTDRFIGFLVAV